MESINIPGLQMIDPLRTFKIGVNETIVDKPNEFTSINPAKNWQNRELTFDEVIQQIRCGHAFSAHFKESYRNTQNFICSDFIAADIDGTMSIPETLEFPFIRERASLIYTTPSHAPDRHRFRIVFLLESTITKSEAWADALLGLAVKVGGDLSIKDAGRMFYGNTRAEFTDLGNLLSKEETSALIAAGSDHRSMRTGTFGHAVPATSSVRINAGQLVVTSSGETKSIHDLEYGTSICCRHITPQRREKGRSRLRVLLPRRKHAHRYRPAALKSSEPG
jgi:hypothetical protein